MEATGKNPINSWSWGGEVSQQRTGRQSGESGNGKRAQEGNRSEGIMTGKRWRNTGTELSNGSLSEGVM